MIHKLVHNINQPRWLCRVFAVKKMSAEDLQNTSEDWDQINCELCKKIKEVLDV